LGDSLKDGEKFVVREGVVDGEDGDYSSRSRAISGILLVGEVRARKGKVQDREISREDA